MAVIIQVIIAKTKDIMLIWTFLFNFPSRVDSISEKEMKKEKNTKKVPKNPRCFPKNKDIAKGIKYDRFMANFLFG